MTRSPRALRDRVGDKVEHDKAGDKVEDKATSMT